MKKNDLGDLRSFVFKVWISAVAIAAIAFIVATTSSCGGETEEERLTRLERREKGFHCLSGWDGSHRGLVRQVRDNLRDPDSFDHIETLISPNNEGIHTVTMKYRARNGFGGMNIETATGVYQNKDCKATLFKR